MYQNQQVPNQYPQQQIPNQQGLMYNKYIISPFNIFKKNKIFYLRRDYIKKYCIIKNKQLWH